MILKPVIADALLAALHLAGALALMQLVVSLLLALRLPGRSRAMS